MLEQMRKSSQSVLIYPCFLIVIAVFVINFGPQSRGSSCDQVMNGNDHYAAQVAGETITQNSFRYGFMLAGGAQIPAPMAKRDRLKETVMDKLIERELLAKEADRLGYVVTDEEVEDQIADSKIIGLGSVHTVPRLQKDGKFNYDSFKTFLQYELAITPKSFVARSRRKRCWLRGCAICCGPACLSRPTRSRPTSCAAASRSTWSTCASPAAATGPTSCSTDAEIADYAAKNDPS